jgi:hypothetical protein
MFSDAWDGEVQSSPVDRTLSQPRTGEKASDAARLVQIQAGKWVDKCIKCIIGQQAVAGLQRPSDAEADPSNR